MQVKQALESDLREVRRIVLDKVRVYPADIRYSVPARGDMRRFSDIDAAILPHEPLPPGLFASVRDALEESHVIYPVDVIDLSQASEAMRQRVLREAIRWNR